MIYVSQATVRLSYRCDQGDRQRAGWLVRGRCRCDTTAAAYPKYRLIRTVALSVPLGSSHSLTDCQPVITIG